MAKFNVGDWVKVIRDNGNNVTLSSGIRTKAFKLGDILEIEAVTLDTSNDQRVRLRGIHPPQFDHKGWFADRFELVTTAAAPSELTYVPLVGQAVQPGDRVRVILKKANLNLEALTKTTGTRVFTVKRIEGMRGSDNKRYTEDTCVWLEENTEPEGWFAWRFELEVAGAIHQAPPAVVSPPPSEMQLLLDRLKAIPDPKKEPLQASIALGSIIDELDDKLSGTPVLSGFATGGMVAKPTPVTPDNVRKGLRVVRGPHWNFANQDKGGTGTIVPQKDGSLLSKSGWVQVKWDHGTQQDYRVSKMHSDLASYEL